MTAELVPVEAQIIAPATLFGTDNPVAIIASATAKANALAGVIRDKKLYSTIDRKEYVRVEGWTMLGTMLGVFPVCTWSRRIEDGSGWEARVEARTLDDRLVGAAEAQCTRDEDNWRNRKEYALRSMAQTRATAKALRIPLGFVMALAGYEATPAEEMSAEAGAIEGEWQERPSATTSGDPATTPQKNALIAIGKKKGWDASQTQTEVEKFSGMSWDDLTKARASAAIEAFDKRA